MNTSTTRTRIFLTFYTLMFFSIEPVNAETLAQARIIESCMEEAMKIASVDTTVGELREQCGRSSEESPIERRVVYEKLASSNPFAILPHKPNYILPATYSKANDTPYGDILQGESFDNVEAKFQISLKFLAFEDLFVDNLDLQFAFTLTSWWQAYNSAISAPFRETNYQPELILNYDKPWSLFGLSVVNSFVSLTHQSNGQAGRLSRSWNRIIAGVAIPAGNFTWSLKTWWRLPEDSKNYIGDPDGDDNPDMDKYMGHGELGVLWKLAHDNNLDLILRNNLRSNENKGAVQLGWSFPLTKHLRGYVEYFNGYGESLIYYNESTERIGVGIKLTDFL